MHQTGTQHINVRHLTRHVIIAGRRATLHGHADRKKVKNAKYKMYPTLKTQRKLRIRIEHIQIRVNKKNCGQKQILDNDSED